MTLTKHKLGEFIEQLDGRNTDGKFKVNDVRGISTSKEFITTKADMDGVSLTSYKVVGAGEFAFVPDTSRRGDKMSLAYNNSSSSYIVSSISCVFRVNDQEKLLPDYLYIYFNRPEFDRYARFNSWGSARETFAWEDMCDIEIDLPPIEVQKKYADIYNAMIANQACYERGLEDLKLTCEGYIEDLRRKMPSEKIGPYIREIDERNKNLQVKLLQGFCMSGEFIEPRRISADISSLKILYPGNLIYNRAVECVSNKFIVALRDGETCAVSNSYIIFTSKDEDKLSNKYLLLWLMREEFARYSKFMSHGTTHENFEYSDMEDVEIPIPDIETQKAIVNIYDCCAARKNTNEKMKNLIKDICPILIKGSLEEANK